MTASGCFTYLELVTLFDADLRLFVPSDLIRLFLIQI